MRIAIPMLLGMLAGNVIWECLNRRYDWGVAFGIWIWQVVAVMTYVFLLWLNAPPEIPAWALQY